MEEPIRGFWHDSQFLSVRNTDVPLMWEGLQFRTLEAAFAATKTPNGKERAEVAAMQPYHATEWGRSRPDPKDPEYLEHWRKHFVAWTIYIVGQKFGLLPNHPGSFQDKIDLAHKLVLTGGRELYYVNHSHDQVWGMCACKEHNSLLDSTSAEGAQGQNQYGRVLMAIRSRLQSLWHGDPSDDSCQWCFNQCRGAIVPGVEAIVFFVDEGIYRIPTCKKHISSTAKNAKRHAKGRRIWHVPIAGGSLCAVDFDSQDEEEAWAEQMGWHRPPLKVVKNTKPAAKAAPPTTVYTCSTAGEKTTWNVLTITPLESREVVLTQHD
jgi:predicted NAD-dependent protein-ADP-ribosyltransferase YbiA (DUF1768 family)